MQEKKRRSRAVTVHPQLQQLAAEVDPNRGIFDSIWHEGTIAFGRKHAGPIEWLRDPQFALAAMALTDEETWHRDRLDPKNGGALEDATAISCFMVLGKDALEVVLNLAEQDEFGAWLYAYRLTWMYFQHRVRHLFLPEADEAFKDFFDGETMPDEVALTTIEHFPFKLLQLLPMSPDIEAFQEFVAYIRKTNKFNMYTDFNNVLGAALAVRQLSDSADAQRVSEALAGKTNGLTPEVLAFLAENQAATSDQVVFSAPPPVVPQRAARPKVILQKQPAAVVPPPPKIIIQKQPPAIVSPPQPDVSAIVNEAQAAIAAEREEKQVIAAQANQAVAMLQAQNQQIAEAANQAIEQKDAIANQLQAKGVALAQQANAALAQQQAEKQRLIEEARLALAQQEAEKQQLQAKGVALAQQANAVVGQKDAMLSQLQEQVQSLTQQANEALAKKEAEKEQIAAQASSEIEQLKAKYAENKFTESQLSEQLEAQKKMHLSEAQAVIAEREKKLVEDGLAAIATVKEAAEKTLAKYAAEIVALKEEIARLKSSLETKVEPPAAPAVVSVPETKVVVAAPAVAPVAADPAELAKAKKIADAWWKKHPKAKQADLSKQAKTVVLFAKDYKPNRNDFLGLDTVK